MKITFNIIWNILFGGWLWAGITAFFALLFMVLIVTYTIGLGLMQIARLYLWPFGHQLVNEASLPSPKKRSLIWKCFALMSKAIYIPFGLVLTLLNICAIVGCTISIIGLPLIIVFFKTFGAIWNPVNKVYV